MQLTPLKFHAIIGILRLKQNLAVLTQKKHKNQKNHALLHQTQQSGEMF